MGINISSYDDIIYKHRPRKNPVFKLSAQEQEFFSENTHLRNHQDFLRKSKIADVKHILGIGAYGYIFKITEDVAVKLLERTENLVLFFHEANMQNIFYSKIEKLKEQGSLPNSIHVPEVYGGLPSRKYPHYEMEYIKGNSFYCKYLVALYACKQETKGFSDAQIITYCKENGFIKDAVSWPAINNEDLPLYLTQEQISAFNTLKKVLRKEGYRHGDLHAKNIMVHEETGDLYLIDFGKSSCTPKDREEYNEMRYVLQETDHEILLQHLAAIEQQDLCKNTQDPGNKKIYEMLLAIYFLIKNKKIQSLDWEVLINMLPEEQRASWGNLKEEYKNVFLLD